ncbi:DUF4376 domain-containing protein [Pseudomonas syringae]|nr:DUF4376 domain-containing protein [Pseudomonas syringae]
MATAYVQFSDSTEQSVIAVFAGPQDPDFFSNLGEVDDSDFRYQVFMKPGYMLAGAQLNQILALDAACAALIVGGFRCDALVSGKPFLYPSNLTDQSNLIAAVVASLLPSISPDWSTDFWCADDSGEWALRPHTASQIQQVGVTVQGGILALIQKKVVMVAAINRATTVAEVQAKVWD